MPYQPLPNLWDDAKASKLDHVDQLVYRSNLLGSDQRITNTGGGNTSSKIMEKDPLTGEMVEVLWVKGSGGDLRTSKRENFSSLYQEKLIGLQKSYGARADKGLKSQAEDDMVGAYAHTTFNLNPRPSSIDTPLHSFLTGKHVDHMHPNAIIAVAASRRCQELTKEIFGGEMEYVGWMRPGFELGLAMQEIERKNPAIKAMMPRPATQRPSPSSTRPPPTSRRSMPPRVETPPRSAVPCTSRSTSQLVTRPSPPSFPGSAVRSASRSALSAPSSPTRRFSAS
jgi:rhamnose utilization protein RhaD (predicted bifunctional aldolase and dehydrogenase)